MPTRNQNWYDLQSGRRYPLDDRSTGVDDAGSPIEDDVLADCHLRFPSTLGAHAFVQGITVTPALVTVIFGVAETLEDTEGPSIAALSVPRATLAAGVNYTVRPLVPGVAGWVAFSQGIHESFVGRYSTPIQTLIAPRCARPYTPLPIPTLGKQNLATSLEGLVTLLGVPPVEAFYDEVTIEGNPARAIVFRLLTEFNGDNPLETFLGACGERPESGTCPKPPIETINGVSPDCDGNINLVFDGFAALPFADCGGIDILASTGLAEACAAADPPPYRRPQDNCNPLGSSAADDDNWYDPIDQIPPDVIESESLPDPGYSESCAVVPTCVDFADGTSGGRFNGISGLFVYETTDAPYGCTLDESESVSSLAPHYTYTAASGVGRNIALFRNCPSDWAFDRTITTELKIGTGGLRRNGGLVLNYLQAVPYLQIPTRYLVALIDGETNKLKVLRINGTATVVEQETDLTVIPGHWYRLSAETLDAGGSVVLNVTADAIDLVMPSASLSVAISNYGSYTGLAGLFSDRSYTYFNLFKVES
jgi:hypothetical protein